MAFYGQYGQFPQTGYPNQNYAQAQYNNFQNTAASASQSTYRYSTASTTSSAQASTQSYTNQYSQYGYTASSSTATNTTTTQQGNAYQQFSSLWYAQSSMGAHPGQSQQGQQGTGNQQQANRANQQQMNHQMYQHAQMNQFYQQQQAYSQAAFQQGSQHQFKGAAKSVTQTSTQQSKPTTSTAQTQSTGTNQQGDWSANNQQSSANYYQNYGGQGKSGGAGGWGNYLQQQQGKDWNNQASSYNQQQQMNANKNGYQGTGGGGGGDYNYSQGSTIQHPPQIYSASQRNYSQSQQQQQYGGYGQGAAQRSGNQSDQYRGYGERGQGGYYGGNQDNRGNWNSGGNAGQGNWNSGSLGGNWGNNGGWGDWNGPRNNARRGGDNGPHIPPFPPAWQMGQGQQPPLPPGGNRGDMKHGNWGPGNKWNQAWDNQNGGRQGGNNARFSRGDGQQQRNDRYSPNSRQSRGAAEKSNRELWSPADSKRGNKEKLPKKEDLDKPIQASEVKAYLYAWLGMRRMRPHYDIHPVGERPDLTFRCELRVTGYKFIGVGEAVSKKDAQTDAAWNFAEFLVQNGQLKKEDLPAKSQKGQEDSNEDFGTVKEYESEKDRNSSRDRHRRPPRNVQKGPIPSLLSIVTTPMGNIPPFPPFERAHPDAWGMPPHRRGGPWDGPGGPWRGGGPRGGRGGGWGRPGDWRQRELEEQYWAEEEMYGQHPEDIFISRMIMNQQEAAMGARRFEGRPGEWVSLAPNRTRNVSTLDDRHVMAKHAAIYPREEELKSVHEMVTLAERALKALSDQFVDEDHPIPKEDDDEEEEEEQKKAEKDKEDDDKEDGESEKKEDGESEKKEEGDDEKEKKTKIQILKRPKKRPRKVPDTRPRVLCAVNRVGTLAKGLLIHDDLNVCLVLLCGSIPTKALLQRILNHLPGKIEEVNSEIKYDLVEKEAGFHIVGHLQSTVTLSVTLTCTALTTQRKEKKEEKDKDEKKDKETKAEEGEGDNEEKESDEKREESEQKEEKKEDDLEKAEDISDMLPKPMLLGALAQLRHSKWFQARASQQDCGVVITRIMRDMRMRNPIWAPLSDWALENLVYVALSSSTEHMSPGDALRRLFEVVAGGVLLADRSGILDPCERKEVDVLDCCSGQELEDITRFAQNALLKIAFRKVHEVLSMEKISMLNPRHPDGFQAPESGMTAPQEEDKEGGRKRRLEHNSSDSLAESPKRSLTDEEGSTDADTQQNLAELSITDQQLKLGAAVSDEATPKEENAPTKPPSTEDVEMMDTDN